MFALKTLTEATIKKIRKNAGYIGKEVRHEVDLLWELKSPSDEQIDTFSGNLREAFFMEPPTKSLPGVARALTVLRTKALVGPFKVHFDCAGYMLTIRRGEVSGDELELAEATVKDVFITPFDGGKCALRLVTRHIGLDAETLGAVMALDRRLVRVMLVPPAEQDGSPAEDVDGKKSKKKKSAGEKDTKTSPFKFSASAEGGGITDNSPRPGDKKKLTPEEVFTKGAAPGSETAPSKD